jgi:hypothetical protein
VSEDDILHVTNEMERYYVHHQSIMSISGH